MLFRSEHQSTDEVNHGGDVQPEKTDRDSAVGENEMSSTAPNNRDTQVPPPPSSSDAFESSLPQGDRLRVATSDGTEKQVTHIVMTIGSYGPTQEQGTRTPERQPSADLGQYMPTAQSKEVSRHYPTICVTITSLRPNGTTTARRTKSRPTPPGCK